eukprot:Gb_35493 [translate_table: standard]
MPVVHVLRQLLSLPSGFLFSGNFFRRRSVLTKSVADGGRFSTSTDKGSKTTIQLITDEGSSILVDRRCSLLDRRTSVPCLSHSVAVLPPAFQDLVDLQARADDVSEHCLEAVGHEGSHWRSQPSPLTSDCLIDGLSRMPLRLILTHQATQALWWNHPSPILTDCLIGGNAIQGFTRRNQPSPHLISYKSLSGGINHRQAVIRLPTSAICRKCYARIYKAESTIATPHIIITQYWRSRPVLRLPHSADLSGITPCWRSKANPPIASLSDSVGSQALGMATTVNQRLFVQAMASAAQSKLYIKLNAAHSPSSFGLAYNAEDSKQLTDSLSLHGSTIWPTLATSKLCLRYLCRCSYASALWALHANCHPALPLNFFSSAVGGRRWSMADEVGFSTSTDDGSKTTVQLITDEALRLNPLAKDNNIFQRPRRLTLAESTIATHIRLPHWRSVGNTTQAHTNTSGHTSSLVESPIPNSNRLPHRQSVGNAIQEFTRRNQPSPHLISYKSLSGGINHRQAIIRLPTSTLREWQPLSIKGSSSRSDNPQLWCFFPSNSDHSVTQIDFILRQWLQSLNQSSISRLNAAHSPSSFGLEYNAEDSKQLTDSLSLHGSAIWQRNGAFILLLSNSSECLDL